MATRTTGCLLGQKIIQQGINKNILNINESLTGKTKEALYYSFAIATIRRKPAKPVSSLPLFPILFETGAAAECSHVRDHPTGPQS